MFDITPITSPKQTDCGATCLKMLLSYYGQDVPLDQLVEECNTSLVGSSGKDIKNAAALHGLQLAAWKADADEIMKSDRPEIIWWMYNHWCIFGGLDDDGNVVIYNPDRGRYRISKGTFRSFYTGVSLSKSDGEKE